jgi:glucuronoarabinoxylan endo-1,4-beta-xylanase
MSKKVCFLISFVLALALASISYGDPSMIKIDFDERGDVNTEPGFASFLLSENGKEVNGIAIDLTGDIDDCRRPGPSSSGSGIPIYTEQIYRDFVHGVSPSGVTVTLWGLGVNQDCNITIYAFDNNSEPNRLADWYGNGEYLFTTNFKGGDVLLWPSPWWGINYAFGPSTATADEFGRIVLTSTRNPASPAGLDFAFVNGLVAVPKGTYVPPVYAQHPVPFDDAEDVPIDAILTWKQGGLAEKHDVYFGTDEAKVTDANRSSPQGVLVSQDHSATTYTPPNFLDLDTTYYWRIDEVNAAPDYTIFKGEVWSFTTSPYFVVENFDSYADNTELWEVWNDGSTNGSGAEVSVEPTIACDANSMKYLYRNNLSPYYSEAYVELADLGIDDPNWLGFGVQALELRFYGEPNNPVGEQMYVSLTDGDNPAKTATVTYDNMNDVRLKQWNKWSIALTEFADVNLTNVARITIGFGDDSPGNAGTVYFEDIMLHSEVEILPEVTGDVNVNTVYQELEGFGASGAWEENFVLGISQPSRDIFYDTVFDELGLDIYRLRNTYDQDANGGAIYIDNSAQIVAAAKQRNPSLKIMISCWSPATRLKSNGSLIGGTLKKDANSNYMYDKFAEWWADSLEEWSSHGVVADYINMQNEPDYTARWDSCRFNATQGSVAGYNLAFEAVYQKLLSQMGANMPKLLVPETAGFISLTTYIDALVNKSHAYAYAHHLYNGGGSYNNPDGYKASMEALRDNPKYNDKPRMQTEFSKGGTGDVTTFDEAMNLAHLIHNSMVFENASAYLYWELFWEQPKGLVSFTAWGYYKINPVYYAFKQYAAFTNPGWHRVAASTSLGSQGSLRISAFKSPDDNHLTIVIINLAYNNINLTLDLNGFLPDDGSKIYRTSETENTAYIGPYDENGSLTMPARSITTIHCAVLSNCANVLAAGYGLTSDIHADCYVNYKDLKIITDYWLNTECALYDDCEGADFEPTDGVVDLVDLSTFAEQWLWCNAPEDFGCTANWP